MAQWEQSMTLVWARTGYCNCISESNEICGVGGFGASGRELVICKTVKKRKISRAPTTYDATAMRVEHMDRSSRAQHRSAHSAHAARSLRLARSL